jgi:hypothetical protein
VSASPKDAASTNAESAIACAVVSATWQAVPSADLAKLRHQLAAAFSKTLSLGILKQVDDQSLLALHSLKQATENFGPGADDCSAWGLVAAPRLLGRKRIAEALFKFQTEGAWSVSPHIIPHCSLHSLPGLLSQGLKIHGPNIGAGGMPGAEAEALWAGLTFLEGERLEGTWIVLTGWDGETESPNRLCQAVVLGLRRASEHPSLPRLIFFPGGHLSGARPFSLESAGEAIRQRKDCRWDIGGGAAAMTHGTANLEAAA